MEAQPDLWPCILNSFEQVILHTLAMLDFVDIVKSRYPLFLT